MRAFIILSTLLLVSCSNTDPKYNSEKILELINEIVEEQHSVGVSYALQIADEPIVIGNFGYTDDKLKIHVEDNSLFRIASITKCITATAIMQLKDKGLISLETPISAYLPAFPNGDNITIYHLLSHTSGIPDWWEGKLPSNAPIDFPMCQNPSEYLGKMKTPSIFKPGTSFSYSNSNYILLGDIIKKVSGEDYVQYIEKEIFKPLSLINTQMEISGTKDNLYLNGYKPLHDGKEKFGDPDVYAMPFSAGGLRSNPSELLTFFNSLLDGDLVSDESLKLMMNYAYLDDKRPVHESVFGNPNFPSNIKKFGYGLGFQIIENFGTKVISHGGDIAGFNSIIMYVPKSKSKLVIMANTENAIMPKLQEIEKAMTSIEKIKSD